MFERENVLLTSFDLLQSIKQSFLVLICKNLVINFIILVTLKQAKVKLQYFGVLEKV
ncbi:hypothetical protein HanRHA438_Chr09g0402641 [Helianthus annuus]|nr:hypothetical protein HanRHA438_Chr09g0402641 [Helianthus annuus]